MRRASPPPYSSVWISTSAAFARPAEPWDRPGVRIGLLQLVDRAMDRELEELVAVRVLLQIARQLRAVVAVHQLPQALRDRALVGGHRNVAAQSRRAAVVSQLRAQPDQLGLPLPPRRDVREPAVVQLVADPQRELKILVQRAAAATPRPARSASRLRSSRRNASTRAARQRPARGRKQHAIRHTRSRRIGKTRCRDCSGSPVSRAASGRCLVEYDERVLRPGRGRCCRARGRPSSPAAAEPGPLLELCAGAGHIGLAAAVLADRDLVQVEADPVAARFASANAARAGWGARVEVRA